MMRRFDDLERHLRGLTPRPDIPPLSDDLAYLASVEAIKGAEAAKDALLEARLGQDGKLAALDLAALDEADTQYAKAVDHHRSNRSKWKLRKPIAAMPTFEVDETTSAILERGYLYMMRAETDRAEWGTIPTIGDLQRKALNELFLQAISCANNDRGRGFAMFMRWCELCAKDDRHLQEEKTPRHLLLSPDICSPRVDLGSPSDWWTLARLNSEWDSQSQLA